MSLSKYYNNSNSFQPEKLVKREEQPPTGWQSSQPNPSTAFQPQQLSSVSPPKNNLDPETTPVNNPGVAEPSPEQIQHTAVKEKQPAPPAPHQNIDLSKYIECTLAEQRIEEAYQKGLQAGKDIVDTEYKELKAATRTLLNTCQQLDTIRETIISNSSDELREFALTIAEKILRISVSEQDDTIIATIEEALQRAVKSDEFTIFIHPEDYDIVSKNSPEIVAGLIGLNKIVVKKDSTVEQGGAKIESDNCTIDATIAGQFNLIREEIKKNA